ncbi:hypothetical protein [Nocardiopsis sp. CC223A]|uniref:hypothetical protein n=1 Tax=Nocardiopsis sp. CC223A TaxID=3044051 RepID=UPI00278C1E92|nr:hypothetical protein [Nocardiopsis sp. CC223A]
MTHLGQALLTAAILPSRAVYLIGEGSVDGFRRAAQEASSRWGGMAEPIVAVPDGGMLDPWLQRVVETADVEAAVNIDAPEDSAQCVANTLQLELVPLAQIDRRGPTMHTCHPFNTSGPWVQAPVIACEEGPLWQVVAAGELTDEHLAHIQERHIYIRRPRTGDEIGTAQLQGDTLLDKTVTQFNVHKALSPPGPLPAVIWVTKPNDFADCLAFWNLRAIQDFLFPAPMLLLPCGEEDTTDHVRNWTDFGRNLTSEPLRRPADFVPDVVLASMSVEEEQLHEIAVILGLDHTEEAPSSNLHFPPAAVRQSPFTYRADINPRGWFFFDRSYGQTVSVDVHLSTEKTAVRFSSPVGFEGSGRALVRFSGSPLEGLPHRDPVAKLIDSEAEWRNDSIQLPVSASQQYRFEFHIPTLPETVHAVLKEATDRYELSDKGRLGVALQETSNVSALLEPNVYEALVALTTPKSKKLLRDLKAAAGSGTIDPQVAQDIAERYGSQAKRRHSTPHNLESLPSNAGIAALEKLCALNWAERGLQTRCDRCGVDSFVPLSQTTNKATCPGCEAVAPYAIDSNSHAPSVFYRLNTFVDRVSDQGVLPHLLAAAALTRKDPQSFVLPGTNLWLNGSDEQVEMDILGVHAGHIIAGEVKTNANQFTQEQIERDVRLSQRLGADTHLAAAVDTIPQSTRTELQNLCNDAGLHLLTLSGNELRPNQI